MNPTFPSSTSRVLSRLRAGQTATCLKLNLGDPRVVELAALSGADAVWVCNEHVPNDWINLENQIRSARIHGIDAIVRVAKGSYSDYLRPLEAGARGLMVPHVSTADEARSIVANTRFHPLGRRPIDGGNVDGGFCLEPTPDYLERSNKETMLIFQIESPEALENVEEIAAVPGFDVLLFGPGDYSHLLGIAGEVRDPRVVKARKRVAAVAKANGKFLFTSGLHAPRAELEAEGFQFFNLGADVVSLARDWQAAVKAFEESAPAPGKQLYENS